MQIGGYEITSEFVTTGSGNARWCAAVKDGKHYFLKQFLAPVQPVQTTEVPSDQVLQRRMRCAAFERRKLALYDALKRIQGKCIVHIEDFFVYDGHYFAVSEYIDPSFPTFESIHLMQPKAALCLIISLAECLRKLHDCGVVHADLKPEHIIIDNRVGINQIRLIDFDSGFLESTPPDKQSNIEVDPVYISPEAYRLITGETVLLDCKLDTFAQGIIMHQALTGELPHFDMVKYTYLYACVLDKGKIILSEKLNRMHRVLIERMLKNAPAKRPGDDTICEILNDLL